MKFRTRRARLFYEIESELRANKPSPERLLDIFEQYEVDNISLIHKLKKKKKVTLNKINGAIKQSIKAHGNISESNFSSTSKRIYGSLLENEPEESVNYLKIFLINFILYTIFYGVLFITYLLFF